MYRGTDPNPGRSRCGAGKEMNGRCPGISRITHLQVVRRRCQAVWIQTGFSEISNAYTTKMQYPFNFNYVTFYYFTIYFKKCCYSCLNCSIYKTWNQRTLRIRTHKHQAVIPTCAEQLLSKGCRFLNKQMCGNAK